MSKKFEEPKDFIPLTCPRCDTGETLKNLIRTSGRPPFWVCENCLGEFLASTIEERVEGETLEDPVNNPKHYTSHPSGVECIDITEYMDFTLGNAVKYIWRASLKGNQLEDLKKALWYIERKIKFIEKEQNKVDSKQS